MFRPQRSTKARTRNFETKWAAMEAKGSQEGWSREPMKVEKENVRAWSKEVLNAPGPPRGVVVPVVHLVHSDPF